MPQLYQVVYTGRLRSGVDTAQAARDFAAVFKVSEEKARKLVLNDAEHILKRDVDDSNATRYRDIFEEIGLEVRVEPAGTPLRGTGDEAGRPRPAAAAPGPAVAEPAAGATRPSATDGERNPYAPPRADLTPPPPPRADGGDTLTGPHQVPAGNGWQWIGRAWEQFRAQPWPWIGGVLAVYAINMVLSLIPLIGGLVSIVLGPVFLGGLMLGAQSQEHGGRFRAGSAFDGFSRNGGQLALIGVLYFVAIIAVVVVATLVIMAGGLLSAGALEALSSSDPETAAAVAGPGLLLFVLVIMLLIMPVIMAYWFAPALVAIDGLPALQAMITSFRACLMNILPFLVYGLALFGLMIGAGIVFGIAGAVIGGLAAPLAGIILVLLVPIMIVFGTVVVVSIYTGYRDVFFHAGGGRGGAWVAR